MENQEIEVVSIGRTFGKTNGEGKKEPQNRKTDVRMKLLSGLQQRPQEG